MFNQQIVSVLEEVICAICLHESKVPQTLGCVHTFCKGCLDEWLNIHNVCPVCLQVQGSERTNRLLEKQQSTHNNQSMEEEPCVDHLYGERKILEQRLQNAGRVLDEKRRNSQSIHSKWSKQDIRKLQHNLDDMWELYEIFNNIINDTGSFSEAVALMQNLHLELMHFESVLNGKIQKVSSLLWEEEPEYDDQYDEDQDQEEGLYDYLMKNAKSKKKPTKSASAAVGAQLGNNGAKKTNQNSNNNNISAKTTSRL